MTFASPFSRVIQRPFGGVPSSAVVPWYLSGGIAAANCVAAYAAKGAADYAASKVNLTGNATYNLVEFVGSPAWDATTGWGFVAAADSRLRTGYIPTINVSSMIVRFQNQSDAVLTQGLCGCFNSNIATTTLILTGRWGANQSVYGNGAIAGYSPKTLSGVMAMAGRDHYNNGAFVATGAAGSGTITSEVLIGGMNGGLYDCTAQILAFAIYSTTITGAQVVALTTAMNAL